MRPAYIGLGSNLGDRLRNLRSAVAALRARDGLEVLRASSVYETEPVGPDQPDFLNAVVEVATSLSARSLLCALKEIEDEVGRTPGRRWGAREIDLDLLLLADERVDEEGLQVPHPRIASRAFVTVPLAELGAWPPPGDDPSVRTAHPPATLLGGPDV